jgi:hypothetical protein
MVANKWQFGFFLSVLILSALACSLFSGISQGQEILTTAQSLATEIDGGEIIATVEALATGINPGELVETVQAAATGFNPDDLLATANAVGTAAAAQGGDPLATAQALATEADLGSGEPPEDIPIIDGEIDDLFTSDFSVSYGTSLEFSEVVQFYQDEMPANGWDEDTDASVLSEIAAFIVFNKIDRTAVVTITAIPGLDQTLVQILIQ